MRAFLPAPLLVLSLLALPPLLASPVRAQSGPAVAELRPAASGAAYAEWKALSERYKGEVARGAGEEILRPLKERLDALAAHIGAGETAFTDPMDARSAAAQAPDEAAPELAAGIRAALNRGTGLGEQLDALLTLFNGNEPAARSWLAAALPAPAERTTALAALQVVGARREIAAFVGGYGAKVDAARDAYRSQSWLNPFAKVARGFTLLREKFTRGKVKASYRAFFNPKENGPYVAYGAEILNEIRHAIPGWNALFHETHLDAFSVPCAPAAGPVDELVFYAIPSPHGMDWESPIRLGIISGGFNQITFKEGDKKHLIGHNFMSLNRADGRRQLKGMTTVDSVEEVEVVTKHGYGFGALFTDLRGKFDDPAKIEHELDYRYGKGLVTRIRFLISPATAERMQRYMEEYAERKCHEHYGGANRPRYGEGGGCSPFATSFLEVGGLMTEEFEREWIIRLRIPLEVCGGPAFGKRVNPFRALSIKRWAHEHEPHALAVFWDPTLMYRHIENEWKREFREPTGKWMIEKERGALCLVKDCRDLPTPDEPIWLTGANPYLQHGYRYGPDPWAWKTDGTPAE